MSTALWLIPAPAFAAPLRAVINELSLTFGGPDFPPHITLLSKIPTSAQTRLKDIQILAETIDPIEVNGAHLACSSEYFRAIVLEIPPSGALLEARAHAERLFARHSSRPFLPHLSLAYGHIDQTRAAAECTTIQKRLPQSFVLCALELVHASTDIAVESWRAVGTFPLRCSVSRRDS